MRIIESLNEMIETARGWLTGGTVGFVPIKSAFHEGHRALIRAALEECEVCIVCILLKPEQSSAYHKSAKHARSQTYDLQQLARIGVDIVFIPAIEELYPPGFATYVTSPGSLVEQLEGASTFKELQEFATTMTKLLQLVRPDMIYVGQKDAQKVAVVRQLIRDFNIDVNLCVLPTLRERDGLAFSNRCLALSRKEREAATVIYQALLKGKNLIERGERRALALEKVMGDLVSTRSLVSLSYVKVCHPDTFMDVREATPGTLLTISAQVGSVYLVDNILWMSDGQWLL